MAPYPALPVAGNEREGIERGGVGCSRDEEGTDEEREREIGGFAIISGKFAPSPAQTVPVGCSAFVWTLVET